MEGCELVEAEAVCALSTGKTNESLKNNSLSGGQYGVRACHLFCDGSCQPVPSVAGRPEAS